MTFLTRRAAHGSTRMRFRAATGALAIMFTATTAATAFELQSQPSPSMKGDQPRRPSVEPGQRTPATTQSKVNPPASAMNPDAKWSCENATVTVPPKWREKQTRLTFEFQIKNVGTADLTFSAHGG